MNETMTHIRNQEGIQGARQASLRIKMKKERERAIEERTIEQMVKECAQSSALQAMTLDTLLTRKWTEEKNSYLIMSNLSSGKEVRRVQDMVSNRYIV